MVDNNFSTCKYLPSWVERILRRQWPKPNISRTLSRSYLRGCLYLMVIISFVPRLYRLSPPPSPGTCVMIDGIPSLKSKTGSGLRIGIVHARWSKPIVDRLVAGAMAQLLEHGVNEGDIILRDVPGCWELPFAVQRYVQVSFPAAYIYLQVSSSCGCRWRHFFYRFSSSSLEPTASKLK